jgi:purine-binding chemotaxis protein CheW
MSAPARPVDARRQVISFALDPELMGFELSYVEKVIDINRVSFVPRAPAFLQGAISHHGKVMAVVDLRRFLGMEARPLSVDSKVLILDHPVYHIGLLVDRVERIESVPMRGPLVQTPEPDEAKPYIFKIINLGGRILNLVDVEKLLSEIEAFFS